MKALFVHGGDKLKVDTEGNYYTGGTYNSKVWARYLSVFPEMTVMLRKEKQTFQRSHAEKNFQYFDKELLGYIEMPDLNASIKDRVNYEKRKEINQVIDTAVQESDYVIIRMPGTGGDVAIKYARKYNKPYLIELVGCPWDALWNHSVKGKILAPFSYLNLKRSVKSAPYVLYVTNEFLQNRYPTNGKSIGCSDAELSTSSSDILEKRLKRISQSIERKSIVLGTVAPVDVRYKGHEFVIEAMSKLNAENSPNVEYHLVGDGDTAFLESTAKKYGVREKVKFHGSIPHDQMFDFLDSIDIYIQPSKTEGLPRAVLEAMSRACLVMASNVGGNPELVDEEFLFSKGSAEEINSLLMEISHSQLKNQALMNFEKAKEFDENVLDEKRRSFYEAFYLDADDKNYILK